MFSIYQELQRNFNEEKEGIQFQVRMGVCSMIGAKHALAILENESKLKSAELQNTKINFTSFPDLIEAFQSGEYNLILGSFEPQWLEDSKLDWHHFQLPVFFVGPKKIGEKFSGKSSENSSPEIAKIVQFANELKIPLILPAPPSRLRHETENKLLKLKVTPQVTVECNHLEAIVELLEAEKGYAFVPEPFLESLRRNKKLCIIGGTKGLWLHRISMTKNG